MNHIIHLIHSLIYSYNICKFFFLTRYNADVFETMFFKKKLVMDTIDKINEIKTKIKTTEKYK